MEDAISLISNVGFPIFAYVMMWKMASDTIAKNTTAISELRSAVDKLCVLDNADNKEVY
jgi:hypothetical protein